MKKTKISKNIQEIVIYRSGRGNVTLHADINKDTIWATQAQIAELFDVDVRTVNEHIKNIYKTNELSEKGTIRKFRTTEFLSNSLDRKIFPKCSLIVRILTSKSSAIWDCVAQIVSLLISARKVTLPRSLR